MKTQQECFVIEALEVLVQEHRRKLAWWKQYQARTDRSDYVLYGGEWRNPPLRAHVDEVVTAMCLMQDALDHLVKELKDS